MHKKDITSEYACLECRKVFKKHKYKQDKQGNWEVIHYEVVCPRCSNVMYETGTAFKAPKSTNIKAWEKLKPLFEEGFKLNPNFGSPFEESAPVKIKPAKEPGSEIRKPARKRNT